MAEPKDMIVPMLKEMREETREFRHETGKRFDKVDQRLDRIEGRQKSFNSAMTADTMMSKFMLGDYEERLGALEAKVDALLKGH
jgi:septation ring formation regulator EzrA